MVEGIRKKLNKSIFTSLVELYWQGISPVVQQRTCLFLHWSLCHSVVLPTWQLKKKRKDITIWNGIKENNNKYQYYDSHYGLSNKLFSKGNTIICSNWSLLYFANKWIKIRPLMALCCERCVQQTNKSGITLHENVTWKSWAELIRCMYDVWCMYVWNFDMDNGY